jgi:hypothetical protein
MSLALESRTDRQWLGTVLNTDRFQRPSDLQLLIAVCGAVLGSLVVGITASESIPNAIILLVGATVAIAMTLQGRYLAIALVAGVPALSGIDRGGAIPILKLSEALTILGAVLALAARPKLQRSTYTLVDWAFAAYAGTSFALGMYHASGSLSTMLTQERPVFQPVIMFFLYRAIVVTVRNRTLLRSSIRALLVASSVAGAIALVQSMPLLWVRRSLAEITGSTMIETGPGVIRSTGPFPIWHSLDGFLLPCVFVALALVLEGDKQSIASRRFLGIVLTINVLAIVSTLTVAMGLTGIPAAIFLGFLYRRTRDVVVGLLVATLVAGALFAPALTLRYQQQYESGSPVRASGGTPQTFTYRVHVWQRDYLPLLEPVLLQGYGNRLPESARFAHTENQYITYLLRGGAPLLIVALGLLFCTAVSGQGAARRYGGPPRALGRAAVVTALALVPLFVIWPYLSNAGFGQSWPVLAGLLVAASRVARDERLLPDAADTEVAAAALPIADAASAHHPVIDLRRPPGR